MVTVLFNVCLLETILLQWHSETVIFEVSQMASWVPHELTESSSVSHMMVVSQQAQMEDVLLLQHDTHGAPEQFGTRSSIVGSNVAPLHEQKSLVFALVH